MKLKSKMKDNILTPEQHNIICDVLELATNEGHKFYKEDLILFAHSKVKNGCTSVDKIISDFFN